MVNRQEEMRRKTAEHEASLRTKTELAKTRAEADGRIRQERENHDLILDKLRHEATERRDTVLKGIADAGTMVGEGLQSYLDDTTKLRNTALTVTGMAVGIYAARTSITVAGRFVESRLGKPSLVRETSRFTATQVARQPIQSAKRVFGIGRSEMDALKGIVLQPDLDTQLRQVAVSTANTKKNRAPFRHLLLHGTYHSYGIYIYVHVSIQYAQGHSSLCLSWMILVQPLISLIFLTLLSSLLLLSLVIYRSSWYW